MKAKLISTLKVSRQLPDALARDAIDYRYVSDDENGNRHHYDFVFDSEEELAAHHQAMGEYVRTRDHG